MLCSLLNSVPVDEKMLGPTGQVEVPAVHRRRGELHAQHTGPGKKPSNYVTLTLCIYDAPIVLHNVID